MDSPWEEDPQTDHATEADWTKLSNEFTNSGYREGIIAGKESALQDGFDAGFARVGVPIGRELGSMRGAISAIASFLSSKSQEESTPLTTAREISSSLAGVRFSDIAPVDHEAEQHAREHLDADNDDPIGQSEELLQKKQMEGLEDMLQRLTAGATSISSHDRPTREDVIRLKEGVLALSDQLGLDIILP
ncbi:hypothetical protein DEU56DRAFT_971605 [Suillus clintonianus]|uniref:uncharacterized protein n=1 Tax=Suillus clintonianus TaxID=1904413 RepID=UPI001B874929|nr:uncharacterized protein DEU56DRAFT_971605 [Suillus clintonianus]KAG2145897.1 hypothetical protein DEU56DRAFT_971605 [Suillus clintonianus]